LDLPPGKPFKELFPEEFKVLLPYIPIYGPDAEVKRSVVAVKEVLLNTYRLYEIY